MPAPHADSFRLALQGDRGIIATRLLDAPRTLVWKALTDPDMIPRWWLGPGEAGLATHVDVLSLQWGGRWRFVQRDPAGNEYAFRGVHHSVEEPSRIVRTFEFEGMPGHVVLETLTLKDAPHGTRLTVHSSCQTPEDRDGLVGSGMEEGLRDSWNNLAELLDLLQDRHIGGRDA